MLDGWNPSSRSSALCETAAWSSSASSRGRTRSSASTATSRRSRRLGRAWPAVRRADDRRAATRPDEPRRRGRQQRRLPAPALRRDRQVGSSASSRRRTSRQAPTPRASRRSRFFGVELADELVAERAAGRPDRRQQRPRPGARPQRLRRRHAMLLAPDGVVTLEFPHLMRLIDENQFDTIYHEHFSYFALVRRSSVLRPHGLEVFDVEELPTHGGSLRDLRPPRRAAASPSTERVDAVLAAERTPGSFDLATYARSPSRCSEIKRGDARVPDRRAARGQVGRRLRRPGQGEDAPRLLRDPHRFPRLHRRSQPATSTGCSLPGTRIPIRRPSGSPRPGPTTSDPALEPPDEIAAQLRTRGTGAPGSWSRSPGSRSSDLGSPAQLRRLSDSSARTPAIASDAVAPGEGALRTWTIRRLPPRRKSSTSVPSGSIAWARTPDGPNRS